MIEKKFTEFDLHGHTRYNAFPEFVNYSPEEAILKAKEIGLDGIAITAHDTVEGLDEALNIAAREGIVLVPGVEISSRIGLKTPHILALGITPDVIYTGSRNGKLPTLENPQTVIAWIHDHGGLAIAAHPKAKAEQTALTFEQVRRLGNKLDGIETVTLNGSNQTLTELALDLNLAQLGSSDFHMLGQIGLVGTKVFGNPQSWQDVLTAIKDRQVEGFVRNDIPEELKKRTPGILLRQLFGKKL